MFPIPVHQPLRVKLHTQQERQHVHHTRPQLQALNDPITADGGHFQRRGHLRDSLVMCAVDAQLLLARYLGE